MKSQLFWGLPEVQVPAGGRSGVIERLISRCGAPMPGYEPAEHCTCPESDTNVLQAEGLRDRFVALVTSQPELFSGRAGEQAFTSLLVGFARLGVTLGQLKTSESQLRALLPQP